MSLYLDTASATPVRREAIEAAWPYLTASFGNASSHHEIGRVSAEALAGARKRVAAVLGMRSTDIVFTSGGTESDNLAIIGMALGANPAAASAGRRTHIVTSAIEHEAVLAPIDYLVRRHGFTVTEVELGPDGTISPEALRAALRPDTCLVSLTYANNEIGTVADIPALAAVAHEVGALFHTDAVQAAGWLPLTGLGADAITLAGHKIGAPKGVGVAAIRFRIPLEPIVHGGGQESGRRSGTENVALAVAFATALDLAEAQRPECARHLSALTRTFIAQVLATIPDAILTGADPATSTTIPVRTPNHASFCFPATSGEAVLLDLERRGITVSSGSACAVGSDEPSHVLVALGIAPEVAQTSVRFTFPSTVTEEQAGQAARILDQVTTDLAVRYA